ncbi:MAG: UDP-phosphate galactose phosphotransferase [Anaerolineaceae bacterium]|nr:UDP-phosphate galactose phosphotransferase [Anaerolineaceae bacterium]
MQEVPVRQLENIQWLQREPLSDGISRITRYYFFKRVFDVTVTLWALILLLPSMLIVALLIRLDSPGPAIFKQERVGAVRKMRNGRIVWVIRTFSFYKFRTMRTDIDAKLHQQYMEAYISGDESKMSELQPDTKSAKSYKLNGDPRITRMGKLLRRLSLDELPQLWNIIKGDMSLVGPRPPIPYEVEKYENRHLGRLAALPGLTGLWQVSGRCETTFEEMVQLDLEYIEKQSIWLDIKILLRTVPAVITAKGAG